MRLSFILVVSLFYQSMCYAQDNRTERIQINGSALYVPSGIPQTLRRSLPRNVGLSYQHALSDKFSVGASFQIWRRTREQASSIDQYRTGYYQNYGKIENGIPDYVMRYKNYMFLDLNAGKTLNLGRHNEFFVNAGPSLAYGTDNVLSNDYYPLWYVFGTVMSEKKVVRLGGTAQLGYNFKFAKSRINIGVSETTRFVSAMAVQLYFNANMGYNFNLARPRSVKTPD